MHTIDYRFQLTRDSAKPSACVCKTSLLLLLPFNEMVDCYLHDGGAALLVQYVGGHYL